MSDTKLDRIEMMLRKLDAKLDSLETKVDELYEDYEDDTKERQTLSNPFVDEETTVKNGQKVPYNRLDSDQVPKFRNFLSHVRMNEKAFTQKEIDYCGFADKTFSDIRISDNARRILGQAYQKAYGKPWSFTFVRGYLYKLDGNKCWRWSDGSID